jgi:hypothetical protein
MLIIHYKNIVINNLDFDHLSEDQDNLELLVWDNIVKWSTIN